MAVTTLASGKLESAYDMARERAAVAKVKAAEAGAIVVPAVVGAVHQARERGTDLVESDAAREARRRAVAVVRAARGDLDVAPPARRGRKRFILGGLAAGIGIVVLLKKFLTGATPPALGDPVATPETSEDADSAVLSVSDSSGVMTGGSMASDGLAAGMTPAGAGTAAGGTSAGNTGGPGLG